MYLPDVSDGTEESRSSISAPVVLVFSPLFSPPPEKTSELSKRNCRCGKRRCAGRCFPNGEAKRSSLFRGVVRGNEKSFDRAIKSRWHLLPRVLPSPCSGPFVKQMQTRSWDSLPPKVAARCRSYVPFTIGNPQK